MSPLTFGIHSVIKTPSPDPHSFTSRVRSCLGLQIRQPTFADGHECCKVLGAHRRIAAAFGFGNGMYGVLADRRDSHWSSEDSCVSDPHDDTTAQILRLSNATSTWPLRRQMGTKEEQQSSPHFSAPNAPFSIARTMWERARETDIQPSTLRIITTAHRFPPHPVMPAKCQECVSSCQNQPVRAAAGAHHHREKASCQDCCPRTSSPPGSRMEGDSLSAWCADGMLTHNSRRRKFANPARDKVFVLQLFFQGMMM